ncbi:dephospho-CoA kinase [Streptococcus anginosus]|uniref:Dephospho-CoA kinase n=1 Tax=Streptococcus anginosus TaxID=1328 RepID=A0AAP2K638_STRAP|nr:dephospho-CoA kinase [Streptococcus anginosus]MBZ2155182.1 dephospho-CoA kinase [Streptococcus anginosus]
MAKIIGITGGIASGKSTVTNYLRQKGYQVIDADQVVHELQAKGGKLYQALVSWLGSAILNEAGELDRPKLSQLIFSSQENLAKSSQLQNDIIRQELANRRDQLAKTEETFFMDIPLLFEQDYADWFDEVWLVYVNPETQIKRLKARNGYSQEEAQQRLASQMKLEDKVPYADFVIKNDGNIEELIEQIDKKLRRLRNDESNGL